MESGAIRVGSKLLGLLIALVPFALLAVWGGAYLFAAFELLLAPGEPVELRYVSPEGPLVLRADSFAADIRRGRVRAFGISLRDPAGVLLAKANSVEVRQLRPWQASSEPVLVTVRDVYGRLELLEGGRPRFLGYLPERREPGPPIPYNVQVFNVDLDVILRTDRERHVEDLTFPVVRVSGVGPEFRASSVVGVDPGVRADVVVRGGVKLGTVVQVQVNPLDVAPYLEPLAAAFPEIELFRDVRASRLMVSGDWRAQIRSGQPVQITARAKADAAGFSFNEFRARSFVFDGLVTESGAKGNAVAEEPGIRGEFSGAVDWSGESVTLGGDAIARAASHTSLPPWVRRHLPEGLSFRDGRADGYVAFGPKGVAYRGDLAVERAALREHEVTGLQAQVSANPQEVSADIRQAGYRGVGATGRLHVRLESQAISGALSARDVNLERLGVARDLRGRANVDLVVSGTVSKPQGSFRVAGDAVYVAAGRDVPLDDFEAVGDLNGDTLNLDRLAASGPYGTVNASGKIDVGSGQMNLDLFASGLPMSSLDPELGGVAALAGSVTGTPSRPVFRGRAEVVQAEVAGQSAPVVGAQIVVTRNGLAATGLRVNLGSAEARGNLSYGFGTGAIRGALTAQGLLLSQWLGRDVGGTVDIVNARVEGTVDHPRADFELVGNELVFQQTRIQSARLQASLNDRDVVLRNLEATAAGGTLSGTGTYNLDSRQGQVSGSASGLLIQRLVPQNTFDGLAEGTLSGDFKVGIQRGQLDGVDASGTLNGLAVNSVLIGSGPWSVTRVDGLWTGTARVGQTERYLLVEDATYREATDALGGSLVAFGFDVDAVTEATRRYWDKPTTHERVRRLIDEAGGAIGAEVELSGTSAKPILDVQVLDVEDLQVGGRPAGRISLSGRRQDGVWNFDHAVWASRQGTLKLEEARYDEGGTLAVDGVLSGFDLAWLSLIGIDLGGRTGTVSGAFALEGPTSSPNGRASLNLTVATPQPQSNSLVPTPPIEALRLELSDIRLGTLAAGGYGLSAEGSVYVRSFTGEVVATVPMDEFGSLSESRPLSVRLDLPARSPSAEEIREYLPTLDPARTQLTLGGWLTVGGFPHELRLAGHVDLVAPTLAIDGVQTHLTQVDADLDLSGNGVTLAVNSAAGSLGGTLGGTLRATVPDVQAAIAALARGSTEALDDASLSGTIQSTGFRVDERIFGDGLVAFIADGALEIGSTLLAPTVRGALTFANASVTMPSEFPERQGQAAARVNPRFDIQATVGEGARLQAANTSLTVSGSGSLGGSLASPDLVASLSVEDGLIRLPTARVTVEEGGTIRLIYRPNQLGEGIQRLDVSLEGRTSLTALRYDQSVERYDISLDITGNLLEDLQLRATSDPPDLSQEQILRLLGQAELLENLTAVLRPGDPERRLEKAVVSFAIPVFFDPITERIASAFGLDYLGLEYNVFDQATFTAAKELLPGLVVTLRRQLFEPPPGIERRHELRLSYRLPRARGALSRVSISVGTDQDTPWKINVIYGARF